MQKTIAILGGDGIGPEVTQCSVGILKAIGEIMDYSFDFRLAPLGHCAIQDYDDPLPKFTLETCKGSDAILLGAVGHPYYDLNPQSPVRPEQGLLRLRQELGLYTNIRPIQVFDELIDASSIKPQVLQGVDILFYRELTGGIYFGTPRERRDDGDTALDTMIYTRKEVERIAHKAFQAASRRRKQLHSADKANVLESSRLWREVVTSVGKFYPEVKLRHIYVDNMAMQLIKNPRQFDVVLTGNMFGDILTDAGSEISGSLGLLPSASVGDSVGLYEPVHGSAPDLAGKGIANPLASILSAALLLEDALEMTEAAQLIRQTIAHCLRSGYRTADIATENTPRDRVLGTKAICEKIVEFMFQREPLS